jgi:nucleotide-binding universal stress UspA family protein
MAQVLIPLDGSRSAERSLQCVKLLKGVPDLDVCLLRVRQEGAEEASTESIQTYLTDHAASLESELHLPVTTKVRHGIPFLAILEEAEMDNVGMIVMTTQGRGTADRGIGSVTDKIARYAPCPTLIVCPSCTIGAIEEIVVPLDGSRLAEEAIPVASVLAQTLSLPVNLIRIVESPTDEASSRAYLSQVHATQLPLSLTVNEIVSQGPVIQTLLTELRERPLSLLVMSSHGGEGFRSYVLGRVSDQVLAETPVPVLLVHSGHSRRIAEAFGAGML